MGRGENKEVVGRQLEHGGLGACVDTARVLIGTRNEQSSESPEGKLEYVGGVSITNNNRLLQYHCSD